MAATPLIPGSRTSSTITSGRRAADASSALFCRGRRGHAMAERLGQLGQSPTNARLVVNNQQVGHQRGQGSEIRGQVCMVPKQSLL